MTGGKYEDHGSRTIDSKHHTANTKSRRSKMITNLFLDKKNYLSKLVNLFEIHAL